MMMTYETVVGLEVHIQLATKSKAFCSDSATFGGTPNTHIGIVSMAHPGALPRANRRQIEFAVRLGYALGCRINAVSYFDRKNYFYADLPKGYQITQDKQPICVGGGLEIEVNGTKKYIRLHHIHMEEDAGKSIHDIDPHHSLIDLNRAGVPLLEIVTEPDFRTGEEVDVFMTAMRQLVRYLEISDGNMEEGSMRCDCNISVREMGDTGYNTRCEVKNMNSMRYARKAIEFETKRQIAVMESGGRVMQNTLNFDPQTGTTSPLRSKEDAHDYRYFPDPDLPPVVLTQEELDKIDAESSILPWNLKKILVEDYALSAYDATILTEEKANGLYAVTLLKSLPSELHKPAANLLINKILPYIGEHKLFIEQYPVSLEGLHGFLTLIGAGQVGNSVAYQQLLPALIEQGGDYMGTPLQMAQKLNLIQNRDSGFLEGIVAEVIAANPQKVLEYKKGKKGLLGFFVGEVMKLSKGKADPKTANALVEKELLNSN
jgi:aspartyl-tRNA(Asn)/glutamyl-tRNA(Gln) amidotransferase subunit B